MVLRVDEEADKGRVVEMGKAADTRFVRNCAGRPTFADAVILAATAAAIDVATRKRVRRNRVECSGYWPNGSPNPNCDETRTLGDAFCGCGFSVVVFLIFNFLFERS